MNRPIGRLYVHVHPGDGRIRLVCTRCGIDRVELSYKEAKREALEHRDFHTAWKDHE